MTIAEDYNEDDHRRMTVSVTKGEVKMRRMTMSRITMRGGWH